MTPRLATQILDRLDSIEKRIKKGDECEAAFRRFETAAPMTHNDVAYVLGMTHWGVRALVRRGELRKRGDGSRPFHPDDIRELGWRRSQVNVAPPPKEFEPTSEEEPEADGELVRSGRRTGTDGGGCTGISGNGVAVCRDGVAGVLPGAGLRLVKP